MRVLNIKNKLFPQFSEKYILESMLYTIIKYKRKKADQIEP